MKISAAQQVVLDYLRRNYIIEVNYSEKDGYFDAALSFIGNRQTLRQSNLRIATFKALFRADLIVEDGRTHHLADHWIVRFRLAEKGN